MIKFRKAISVALVMGAILPIGACSSIRESRGFVQDGGLIDAVQPGIDNRDSVVATLGRPTFISQYGDQTWYYISSVSGRPPFARPKIKQHSVLQVRFDEAGNVISAERKGVDQVASISPDGDKTPTLGRERSFFEDLFGNIGTVGAGGAGGGAGGPGGQ